MREALKDRAFDIVVDVSGKTKYQCETVIQSLELVNAQRPRCSLTRGQTAAAPDGSCCTMKKSRCRLWDCRRLWRKSCPTASIGDSSYQSCGRREVFDRSLSDRKAGLWPAFFIPTYCLVPVVREAHDGDIVLDGGSTVSVSSRFRLFFCESCVLDSLEYHFLCKSRQRPRRNLLCSCGRRGVPYILMASRGFLTFS